MKKLTKSEITLFKSECRKWIDKLELNDWKVYYIIDKDEKECEKRYASIKINLTGRVAFISLSESFCDEADKTIREKIIESAKHEIIHLLLARLVDYGESRFVMYSEMEEAEEEVVRKLEVFL